MSLMWQRALKRSGPVDRQGGDSWEEMGIVTFSTFSAYSLTENAERWVQNLTLSYGHSQPCTRRWRCRALNKAKEVGDLQTWAKRVEGVGKAEASLWGRKLDSGKPRGFHSLPRGRASVVLQSPDFVRADECVFLKRVSQAPVSWTVLTCSNQGWCGTGNSESESGGTMVPPYTP